MNGHVTDNEQAVLAVVIPIETLSRGELQYWLQRFIREVRKEDRKGQKRMSSK